MVQRVGHGTVIHVAGDRHVLRIQRGVIQTGGVGLRSEGTGTLRVFFFTAAGVLADPDRQIRGAAGGQ